MPTNVTAEESPIPSPIVELKMVNVALQVKLIFISLSTFRQQFFDHLKRINYLQLNSMLLRMELMGGRGYRPVLP